MEDSPLKVSDSTAVTIPIRNLLAICVGVVLFMAQFFLITSRLTNLEEDSRLHSDEIERAKLFRYEWSRGELGLIGIDIEQNIRLDHVENDVINLKGVIEKHAEQDDEHN